MNKKEKDEDIKERHRLFKKYIEPNLNLIYKICIEETKDEESIDDNYQECLVNFYKYIRTYDESRSLSVWIGIVSKRLLWACERKRYKRDSVTSYLDDVPDSYATYEPHLEITGDNYRTLFSDDMLTAIDGLNSIRRRAFMQKIMGFKLKEIAEMEYKTGSIKSENIDTVKSRVFLARKSMQESLKNYNEKGEKRKN